VSKSASPPLRDNYLDWVVGLACIFMMLGHAVTSLRMPTPLSIWTLQVEINNAVLSWFFIGSGMNVARTALRDRGTGWRSAAGYVLAMAALFVLGIAYSMNRRTLGFMDLFQCVAACTTVTYLLVRRRWPGWALLTIGTLLFAAVVRYSYQYFGYLPLETSQAIIKETLAWPLWERFLFVHFALLPYVGWFMTGAVIYQWIGTPREKILWIFFAALIGLSFWAPWYTPRSLVDFFFRYKIDYVFRTGGIGGLLLLAARRWYHGAWRVNRAIEFIGRESLLIFILQWFIADTIGTWLAVAGARSGQPTWKVFPLLQAATVFGTYFLTKAVVAYRDRAVRRPGYLRFWLIFTIIFTLLSGFRYETRPAISWLFSFPLIIGVAFLLPAARVAIRRALQPHPAKG